MRTGWFTYLTLVALHGIFLHVAQCRKKRQRVQTPVRCEAGSHTFYHHQAGACLQCDTCTEGYSLVPAQEFSLKMDQEHGVTNCLPCRICEPGTFNDKRTFDSNCRTCRNCTALGRVEESPCTHKADAVCGDVIELSIMHELQASAEEVKADTYQDPSSQNVVLVILLILLTFFTLITTAIVFLRRAYRRASVRQCIEDAKKKSEDEESLQCLNNYQPKNSQPLSSSESTVVDIHVPTENEETRPKEKAHNTERSAPQNTINNEPRDRVPSPHLISESTTVKTPKSSNCSSWNLGASDFMSATPGGAQFTIGYTNLALSRSLTCPSSDRCSVPGEEDESLEMLSQFSYVLD